MGTKAYQKLQLGKESTAGTAVAATDIWRGVGNMPEDARTMVMPDELTPIAVPGDRIYTAQIMSSLNMAETEATYEQLPILLSASMKDATGTAGGNDYEYVYDIGLSSANTLATYTIESGDDQQTEEMNYCFVTDWTLTAQPGEAMMMSANWVGRELTNTTATSVSLAAVEEILAGNGTIHIDDSSAIGTDQFTNTILGMSMTYNSGWRPKFFIDGDRLDYGYHYFDIDSWGCTLNITFEHDSDTVNEKADFRANNPRAIRMLWTGNTIAGGTTYTEKTLQIDFYGVYTSFGALSEQDGNSIYQATLEARYNVTEATSPVEITVANELTAIP